MKKLCHLWGQSWPMPLILRCKSEMAQNAWGGPPGGCPLGPGSPWTRSSLAESGACNWREAGPGGPARTRASAPQAARQAALGNPARQDCPPHIRQSLTIEYVLQAVRYAA